MVEIREWIVLGTHSALSRSTGRVARICQPNKKFTKENAGDQDRVRSKVQIR
jgi:hypothetical protein